MLSRLAAAGVEYVVVGGWAVNAHGYHRVTQDLDICPDPDPANLERLASLLRDVGATQLGLEEFQAEELPADPKTAEGLGLGGNFRLLTEHGVLDILQWLSGDGEEFDYANLAPTAEHGTAFGVPVTVCSLEALLSMKRAAGRPKDLDDLEALGG